MKVLKMTVDKTHIHVRRIRFVLLNKILRTELHRYADNINYLVNIIIIYLYYNFEVFLPFNCIRDNY